MAATLFAMLGRLFGSSLQNAFAQLTGSGVAPQNLDIIQIVYAGSDAQDQANVLVNVDYTGVVHNPASGATKGTRFGVFKTGLNSGDTTAHYFANAFSNPALYDILQVVNDGGNISYYIDYLGVAHGS